MKLTFDARTRKLSLSYLAVIMTMSLLFSAIIYSVFTVQLENSSRPPTQQPIATAASPADDDSSFTDRIHERNVLIRNSVVISLISLNVAVLLSGAAVSYLLARKSLEPIEKAMEVQAQFVSDASHELKTPLTAIQIQNEVALRKKTLTTEKAREVFQKNINEVTNMRELSDNLLILAGVRNQEISLEHTDIAPIITATVNDLEVLASPKNIKLTVQADDDTIKTSPSVVTQIVRSLVDNAIKYSPEKSEISVTGKKQKNHYKISVKDNGPGISPENQARIFDRFYRVDEARSRGSNQHGYGLGLAIAKSLAQRLNAELSVSSKLGSGATFTLILPR